MLDIADLIGLYFVRFLRGWERAGWGRLEYPLLSVGGRVDEKSRNPNLGPEAGQSGVITGQRSGEPGPRLDCPPTPQTAHQPVPPSLHKVDLDTKVRRKPLSNSGIFLQKKN